MTANLTRPAAAPAQTGDSDRPARTFLGIPAFLVLYVVAASVWRVPGWIGRGYVAASVFAFVMYAVDKSAAKEGAQRVPENALLTIGLVGGWPGAIVARQVLRHKSSKASFRSGFWGTVLLNVAAFLVVASPLGRQLFTW